MLKIKIDIYHKIIDSEIFLIIIINYQNANSFSSIFNQRKK